MPLVRPQKDKKKKKGGFKSQSGFWPCSSHRCFGSNRRWEGARALSGPGFCSLFLPSSPCGECHCPCATTAGWGVLEQVTALSSHRLLCSTMKMILLTCSVYGVAIEQSHDKPFTVRSRLLMTVIHILGMCMCAKDFLVSYICLFLTLILLYLQYILFLFISLYSKKDCAYFRCITWWFDIRSEVITTAK